MKNLTRVSGTAALILSQAVLLGACGRFSPAALTKAVTPASTASTASAAVKPASTKTENFSCVSKTVTLASIVEVVGERTQVTEVEKTTKGQRKVTTSADGKTETVEITGEQSETNFLTALGEVHKQTEARTYTLNEKRETARQQYENGVTQDDTVTTIAKKVTAGDTYQSNGKATTDSTSTVKTMSVYKVVGNETQGVSKQVEKEIASADKTVTTKSVEGAVTKTVKKMTEPVETKHDGGITTTQTVDDETCTFEAAK